MVTYDRHPPLYFWALHIIILIFGPGLFAPILFNIIISWLSAYFLFLLTQRFLKENDKAAWVTAVWFISAGAIASSKMVRQYELLALFTMAYVYMGWPLLEDKQVTWKSVFAFTLITLLGMLTHYLFAFVIISFACVLIVNSYKSKNVKPVYLFGLSAFALIPFLIIHPNWITNLMNDNQATLILIERLKKVPFGFLSIITEDAFLAKLVVLPLLVLLGFMLNKPKALTRKMLPLPIFLFVLIALKLVAYMMGLTPTHAIGSYYFADLWPFVFIVLASLFTFSKRGLLNSCFLLFLIMTLTSTLTQLRRGDRRLPEQYPVVMLEDRRGYILSAVCKMPADQKIYIASSSDSFQEYMNHIDSPDNLIYIHSRQHGEVNELINQSFEKDDLDIQGYYGKVYLLKRK